MEWFPQFRIFVKGEFEKLEERVLYIGIDEEATDVSPRGNSFRENWLRSSLKLSFLFRRRWFPTESAPGSYSIIPWTLDIPLSSEEISSFQVLTRDFDFPRIVYFSNFETREDLSQRTQNLKEQRQELNVK